MFLSRCFSRFFFVCFFSPCFFNLDTVIRRIDISGTVGNSVFNCFRCSINQCRNNRILLFDFLASFIIARYIVSLRFLLCLDAATTTAFEKANRARDLECPLLFDQSLILLGGRALTERTTIHHVWSVTIHTTCRSTWYDLISPAPPRMMILFSLFHSA